MKILGEGLEIMGMKFNWIEFWEKTRFLVKDWCNKRIWGKDSEICEKTMELRE